MLSFGFGVASIGGSQGPDFFEKQGEYRVFGRTEDFGVFRV